MILIAANGPIGAGKTTFGTCIDRVMTGYGVRRMSFAKPIRDVVEIIFGKRYETQDEKAAVDSYWDPILRGSPGWGTAPITGRRILQVMGTEVFRNHVHRDIWTLVTTRLYDEARASGVQILVYEDCRFPNEAKWVHERNGIVVKLVNPNLERTPEHAGADEHASEAPLPPDLVDVTLTCTNVDAILAGARLIISGYRGENYCGIESAVLTGHY